MSLKKLQDAEDAATTEYRQAREDFRDKRDERIKQATAKIDAELAAEAANVDGLCREMNDASQRLADAREAESLAGKDAPHPPGTKLYEWKRSGWASLSELKPTGRVGVLEVWTAASEIMKNQIKYPPARGDFVIRVLKADGTPGKQIIRHSFEMESWHKEGWKPKRTAVPPG